MREAAEALGVSYREMVRVVQRLTPGIHFDIRAPETAPFGTACATILTQAVRAMATPAGPLYR